MILVDEAHRSQTSTLHANLMAALPNAAKIGFTGTPIMREGKKRTEAIFGEFIDKYTIRQAEADGAVVPIFYEGRTAKGAVAGGSDLDELFEDMFADLSDAEIEKLKARYATTGVGRRSAQADRRQGTSRCCGTTSRPSCRTASRRRSPRPAGWRPFATARRCWLRATTSSLRSKHCPTHLVTRTADTPVDIDGSTARRRYWCALADQLELIEALDFVPVISGSNNDDPTWAQWTDKTRQDAVIEDFKKKLGLPGEKTSPVAFLIVRTMLLTGFDAPVEQVLYLDRSIQDAELLQAIARVNRTATGKIRRAPGRLLRRRGTPTERR